MEGNELADYILPLKNGNATAINAVYNQCFPMVAAYVQANNGNKEDAEDVFQEAMMVFLTNIQQPNFRLTAAVSTYIFAIGKNIWLQKLRQKKTERKHTQQFSRQQTVVDDEPTLAETHHETSVGMWLARATKHCQAILTKLFLNKIPMQQLMHTMGWKNKHTAANQKYKCLQQVKQTKEETTAKK